MREGVESSGRMNRSQQTASPLVLRRKLDPKTKAKQTTMLAKGKQKTNRKADAPSCKARLNSRAENRLSQIESGLVSQGQPNQGLIIGKDPSLKGKLIWDK